MKILKNKWVIIAIVIVVILILVFYFTGKSGLSEDKQKQFDDLYAAILKDYNGSGGNWTDHIQALVDKGSSLQRAIAGAASHHLMTKGVITASERDKLLKKY